MMVIHDVTNTETSSSSVTIQSNRKHSSITPFKKVLENTQAVASSKANVTKKDADVSNSTSVSSGSITGVQATGGVSSTEKNSDLSGEVSLKSLFEAASQKYDISYDFLVAVAKAESDFNTKCVSSAGAKGIMQLMPDECKEFGVTDPYDAKQNIMASAKLLKAHLKKFNGDFTLAAAAYNAGSGAVKKYGGVPPYQETQNYVKKINKFMKEGVTVPDKTVTVGDEYSGSGGSTGVENQTSAQNTQSTQTKEAAFDKGKEASDKDWEKVLVSVGTGDDRVTMTYGAYLRYLELGTTGVG